MDQRRRRDWISLKAPLKLVAKLRRPPGEPVDLASDDAFTAVPEVDEVLHGRYGFVRQYYDWSHERSSRRPSKTFAVSHD